MSQAAYSWGTERPAQRIKRLADLDATLEREIAKEESRHKKRMDALRNRSKAVKAHLAAVKAVTAGGRIDRQLEKAKAKDLRMFDEGAPETRGRGRPRKHFLDPSLQPTCAAVAKAPKKVQGATPKAAKPKGSPSSALPRREMSAAVAEDGILLQPVMQAAPAMAEPVRTPKAKDPALAELLAIDLSDVNSLPKKLEAVFPHSGMPINEEGLEDSDKISADKLALDDLADWVREVGYKDDTTKFNRLLSNHSLQEVYNLWRSEVHAAMVHEAGRRHVWYMVRNRVQQVVSIYPNLMSGETTLEAFHDILSKLEKTNLMNCGPAFQPVYRDFVLAMPWPKEASWRGVILADGRGNPNVYSLWTPTNEKAYKRLVEEAAASGVSPAPTDSEEDQARKRMGDLIKWETAGIIGKKDAEELKALRARFVSPLN